MNRKIATIFLSLFLCSLYVSAQVSERSELEQKAEAEQESGKLTSARYTYVRAFRDYARKGQIKQGVLCGAKAAQLYYKDNDYEEAFNLLHRIDSVVIASKLSDQGKAGAHYFATKERMQMYMKLHRPKVAKDQLNIMENQANASNDEEVKNDLLYSKAIFYYTYGMNAQGNAVFKEMAQKLTDSKDYDKVEDAYKTLIANGRRSNNASMVAQSYSNYIAWKDSAQALKHADEIKALKQQIADDEVTISEKDSSLTTRSAIIVGLAVLAGILAAALILGAIVLMRSILLTRKQAKAIKLSNDNNALKAKFISNISAQLEPTLKKLDGRQPEVKALLGFSEHIQTLSELENSMDEEVELEETQVNQYCEDLINQIRDKVKKGVALKVDAPKMSVKINREYVSHILLHLLNNAAIYAPEDSHIELSYKKRGAHTHQFLVSNTGIAIPEEERDNVFKPFVEIRDLTQGDGLGLPICKQMALKMKGDLNIDPAFTKGVRFVLELHA